MSANNKQHDQVILVDRNDNILGTADKLSVHQLGLLHRAFSIFLWRYNPVTANIEILLQQRAANKYHSALLWSNTCCSHPQPNEDLIITAQRRVTEELNLICPTLIPSTSFIYQAKLTNGLIEHELDHILLGELPYQPEFRIKPNPNEVAAIKWQTLAEINTAYELNPRNFTAWFASALNLINWKLLT